MTRRPCGWCGSKTRCNKGECPAKDSECKFCGKIGHWEKVCRMKLKQKQIKTKVHKLKDDTFDDEMNESSHDLQSIDFNSLSAHPDPQAPHLRPMWFNDDSATPHLIEAEVDSGAGCNTFPLYLYKRIFNKVPMDPPTVSIKAFGDQPVKNLGSKTLTLHIGKRTLQKRFQVCDVRKQPIIGRQLAEEMGYIRFPPVQQPAFQSHAVVEDVYRMRTNEETPKKIIIERPTFQHQGKDHVIINNKRHNLPISREYILREFEDVFTGIGELPGGEYDIKMKPNAHPIQHAPRRVPEKRKPAYKAELERLVRENIITPVESHTDWVNSVVTVDKPDGSLRLCLDPSDVNKNVRRNQYPMKSIEEISAELHGSKFFTLIDAKSGYWQVKLNERSSYITTFNTPWGKHRFLRLPFGLKVASDVFQERLDGVLKEAHGATGLADDCLITGNTQQEHDVNLIFVLHLARMNNLKFNSKKLQFRTTECKFFGQMLTPEGIRIDPDKLTAIQKMQRPSNKQELESYLGMVNYLKRHSYELTRLTRPFTDLMKRNAIFSWESQHEESFNEIKRVITNAPVLTYFDVHAKHIIQTDASCKGFGAVLLQNGKPVLFAGRALIPAEKNYSTLEKELTAIVFALRRMHNYIHGGHVTVQTDHKPLVPMFNREVHLSTIRQQRLLLKLHEYDLTLEYLKGKDNVIADALSRMTISPEDTRDSRQDQDPETTIPVHAITNNISASESRLMKLRKAATTDPTMSQLAHYILQGWPQHRHLTNPEVQDYWNYKNELSVEDGIIYKNDRLVIPESERSEFIRDLHAAHLGEEKTLLRARQLVYWPRLTEDIKAAVRACSTCRQTDRQHRKSR
eukprot:GHVO01070115.1.p1 GENE.GHVO01070115.1~~GHVO01070115.1.p1  ORF type:complete len:862 (+),score=100.28 GHVO01070115.1:29-2587(+)